MTLKAKNQHRDWWYGITTALYERDKFSTPEKLRERARFTDQKEAARLRRMATRRDFAFEIYRELCKNIDDEGDVKEIENGET